MERERFRPLLRTRLHALVVLSRLRLPEEGDRKPAAVPRASDAFISRPFSRWCWTEWQPNREQGARTDRGSARGGEAKMAGRICAFVWRFLIRFVPRVRFWPFERKKGYRKTNARAISGRERVATHIIQT